MTNSRHFIVVDLNPEGLSLLSRTLIRKFPHSSLSTFSDVENAIQLSRTTKVDAIVVHRPIGMSGEDAIRQLRQANAETPIVMVSGTDRRESALAAGASNFLLYDEWLLLGGVVADLLKDYDTRKPWPKSP